MIVGRHTKGRIGLDLLCSEGACRDSDRLHTLRLHNGGQSSVGCYSYVSRQNKRARNIQAIRPLHIGLDSGRKRYAGGI